MFTFCRPIIIFVLALSGLQALAPGQTPDPLFTIPDGVEMRWASPENRSGEKGAGGKTNGGRKGSAFIGFKKGQREVLAEVTGHRGIVRRFWVTISDRSPEMLRGLTLEIFWDGADKPAVAAPLGDFFGHGLGREATFRSALFASPEGRSYNCYVPMPFKTGMKIVVTNESGKDLEMFYYDVDYTLGDALPDNMLYFHSYFRRENPTTLQRDYEVLPKVTGRGRYLGAHFSVLPDERWKRSWWGEGEVKVFLDGDKEFPTLCGTGTEDYIGDGWGQGVYSHLYQGSTLADTKHFLFSYYRLRVLDPVYFHKEARVTIQQIGWFGGHQIAQFAKFTEPVILAGPGRQPVDFSKGKDAASMFERTDDWSSCVYFYLDKPSSDLPPLLSAKDRIAGLDEATVKARVER